MAMTDDQLRALVRAAIDRHFGGTAGAVDPGPPRPSSPSPAHPSHAQYVTIVNAGDRCVIQPDVDCDHCGYCKSHGH